MQGPLQTKSLVKFMRHICPILLSGSDIWFLGTTGPEPEPDSKKQPDIWPSGTGYLVHPYNCHVINVMCKVYVK